MSIYRGTGSASTTTDQATIDEVTTQATNAANSATSAASSASSAASSASSASSSASTATSQASAASTSASNASASASTASTKAGEASTSATAASASATTASSHETNAETAKDAAVVAQGLAEDAQTAAETAKDLAEGFKDLAASSASSASSSASTATTKAGEALASANSASDAQTAAEAAQAAAEAAQAAIDGTYLGALASNPTGDGNGDDVTVGDWYFNTTSNQAYIYNGSTWDALAPDLIGDATPQLGGNLDTNGNDITFGDNDKATFGAGSDLQIYHDSGSSANIVTSEFGSGTALYLLADDNVALLRSKITKAGVTVNGPSDNYSVELHHNGAGTKLETTNTGIDVTGTITFDGGTTSADVNFGDNNKANFGAGNDLRIYHDGTNSYIDDEGTGDLNIRAVNLNLQRYTGETYATFENNGAATIYYDNSPKLATTNTGIDVTGTVTADGLTVDTNTLYVDATNNRVGVGTTSPNRPLQAAMNNAGATVFSVKNDGAVNAQIGFQGSGSANDANCRIGVASDTDFVVFTGNSESLRVDDSGNVGIGVTPSSWGSAGATGLQVGTSLALGYTNATGSFIGGNSYYSASGWKRVASGAATAYLLGGDGSHTWYSTSTSSTADSAITFSQPMTLDASGNLLVGGTASLSTIFGTSTLEQIVLSNSGQMAISRNGTPLFLNRLSDGEILSFRKDGAPVGSIYTNAADGGSSPELCIASGNTGLKFDDTNNYIRPTNSAGALRDNIVDLGESDSRFKNLYLSGTANVNTLLSLGTSSTVGRIRTPNGISIADDSSITLTASVAGGYLLNVYESGTGSAAVYFINFAGQPVILAQNGSVTFSTSDVDGNYCVIKSTGSHNTTFKNRNGVTRNFHINLIGGNPI